MNSTLCIIIGLACICFHLRKLRESIDKQDKPTSVCSNNVKFCKAKKFVIKRKN